MKNKMEPINIFDFDGTLTTETWPKCCVWVKKLGYCGDKRNDNLESALAEYRLTHSGDILETFFAFFNDLLAENNETITFEELMEGEKFIKYNPGLTEFLKNSTQNNYIVSSGLVEFMQRLKIAKYFDGIYGTQVLMNKNGLISGIGEVITEYKKITAIKQILKKNNRKEDDCHNVYYIGDGGTDAIAMEYVHSNGGKAVFVHQPYEDGTMDKQTQNIYETMNDKGIIDFCYNADYGNGSELAKCLGRHKRIRVKINNELLK